MTKISHFNAQIQIINQLYKDQALIEVIDACRELMKGFPKSKLLYDLRIFEFDKLERYNDAEQCFRQIINNDPDNAEHCNGLTVFLTKQNKIEEAISVYKKSISIDLDYFKPLSNLDDALQKRGDLEEANKYRNMALTLSPDNVKVLNNMGAIFYKKQ